MKNPYTTRVSVNRTVTPFNPATAYYDIVGNYVVVDDITKQVVQITDKVDVANKYWKPDLDIVNPYLPYTPITK